MDERSIAEIIGIPDSADSWGSPVRQYDHDDLLAWLRHRVGRWEIHPVGAKVRVATRGPRRDSDGYLTDQRICEAATLLGALEAIVRDIAGEESHHPDKGQVT